MNPEDNLTPPDVREVECYGCAGEGKVVRFSGIFTCKRCGGDGTLTGSAADEQAREIDDQARLDEERGK